MKDVYGKQCTCEASQIDITEWKDLGAQLDRFVCESCGKIYVTKTEK